MRRRDTFIRSQLLAKIEGETSKARELLSQRAELQEQRKRANMCGFDQICYTGCSTYKAESNPI